MNKKEILKTFDENIEISNQEEFTYKYSKYLKYKLEEFIEELKHNQKINMEKGLENRIDIDYVIERLQDILIMEE